MKIHKLKSGLLLRREPGRSAGAAGALVSTRFFSGSAERVKPPRIGHVRPRPAIRRESGRINAAMATP